MTTPINLLKLFYTNPSLYFKANKDSENYLSNAVLLLIAEYLVCLKDVASWSDASSGAEEGRRIRTYVSDKLQSFFSARSTVRIRVDHDTYVDGQFLIFSIRWTVHDQNGVMDNADAGSLDVRLPNYSIVEQDPDVSRFNPPMSFDQYSSVVDSSEFESAVSVKNMPIPFPIMVLAFHLDSQPTKIASTPIVCEHKKIGVKAMHNYIARASCSLAGYGSLDIDASYCVNSLVTRVINPVSRSRKAVHPCFVASFTYRLPRPVEKPKTSITRQPVVLEFSLFMDAPDVEASDIEEVKAALIGSMWDIIGLVPDPDKHTVTVEFPSVSAERATMFALGATSLPFDFTIHIKR